MKSTVEIIDTIPKHVNFDLVVNECTIDEIPEVFRI